MQDSMIIAVISVALFCGCCHFFLSSIFTPMPVFNNTVYSKTALRVKKFYKSFSWGIMTLAFLMSLVISVVEIMRQME